MRWNRQQQQQNQQQQHADSEPAPYSSSSSSSRGRGRGSGLRGRGGGRVQPGSSSSSSSSSNGWGSSNQGRAWPQQQQQQQQPQLLFQGSRAGQGSAADEPQPGKTLSGLLIAKLSDSRDLQELAQVLEQHKTALGPVHISAAISRAARLHPGLLALRQPPPWQQQQQQQQLTQQQRQQQQLQGLLSLLLPRFVAQLPQASFVEVSCVVGGLARMGCYNAPSDVIDACLDVTRHALYRNDVSNKELLQLGWGLARMGRQPDSSWLAAFEAATRDRMPSLNHIETANVLWAFAKWGTPPSPAWLAAYLAHLPGQLLALQPPELCSVMWAAAMLQLALPAELLDGLLLEAQVKFGGFTGQGLGTLAWSLARLDIRPQPFWLQVNSRK
uniref:FAST kinase leucine-rich domain-containing protein n=1 Tax=Tetradesmus obliquus TaxID=3088 RepID=A0A383VQ41_TETOB|eukprot:jgi/Sobl393_1/1994/SZX67635.1